MAQLKRVKFGQKTEQLNAFFARGSAIEEVVQISLAALESSCMKSTVANRPLHPLKPNVCFHKLYP
ncbi:hypothetical protein DFQ15_107120 [Xylophilus ampelinus]|uniref:Uncharacterized protein n=1 Tax=Xylophilus ampelinus TaxID=54067 RepID=A0A318SNH5_9BURK|nr:hypothetical protein DFQ15_107120 [Xylophilus ampelinus]